MSKGLNISFTISAIDNFSQTMSKLDAQTQRAFEAVGTIGKVVTGLGAAGAAGIGVVVKQAAVFESAFAGVNSCPLR